MPNNNVAILSIMSKFDEKSAREAAKRADKVYEEALSDIGNVNFDKKLIENFDKAMNLLKNKFKKVNLSSYTNSLLDSIFSDKDIKEKSKDIELFISKIEMLKKASSGQDINAFNTFSAKQIDALISRTEKLAEKQEEINEKTREYNREATKIAKANRSITTIDKNYGNQDYSKTLESLKKSLGTEKEFTAEQNQSIENLAKMVNLYQTMEKSEPQKGTAEAIRYSKDLLDVTQKIKEERDKIDSFSQKGASTYITNNGLSSVDKVSDYTVNKSKEDFVKASLSNLKSQEAKLQSELTTYISDSVQKNLAKVSKEVDAVVDKAEKRVENLQNKIETLQTKSTKTDSDNSIIGGIVSKTDIKSLEEIEDRLYTISDLDADGEATKQQLKEYIQLYKQYEQLVASDSTVKFDPGLKEEYDFILESDSKLKKYADTLDETIAKQKELNTVKSDEYSTSVDTQTEQLVKQEEQIKETIQAEKQLQDTQEKISSNTKFSVDAEQAIADINKIKENLDSIPNEKNIKINVSSNDYSNTPLLSNELGEVVTAFRGVKDAWSGLINDKGIGFFTDKLKLAVDYADELSKDGKVYQANLSFHNPLEVDGKGARWDQIDFNGIKQKTDDIIQLAKQLGHDGVIFKNIRDGFTDTDEDISNVMVALNAAQIKNEQVIGTVKAGTGEMVDVASKIDNVTDTATNSTVESQNKIQEELKETQKVAEQVSEAMSNVGSNKSNISSENIIGSQAKENTQALNDEINSVNSLISAFRKLYETNKKSYKGGESLLVGSFDGSTLSHMGADFSSIETDVIDGTIKAFKDTTNQVVSFLAHTHPGDVAAFSAGDIYNAFFDYINNQIKNYFIIAKKEISWFDTSSLDGIDHEEFLEKFKDNKERIVQDIQEETQVWSNFSKYLTNIFDGDLYGGLTKLVKDSIDNSIANLGEHKIPEDVLNSLYIGLEEKVRKYIDSINDNDFVSASTVMNTLRRDVGSGLEEYAMSKPPFANGGASTLDSTMWKNLYDELKSVFDTANQQNENIQNGIKQALIETLSSYGINADDVYKSMSFDDFSKAIVDGNLSATQSAREAIEVFKQEAQAVENISSETQIKDVSSNISSENSNVIGFEKQIEETKTLIDETEKLSNIQGKVISFNTFSKGTSIVDEKTEETLKASSDYASDLLETAQKIISLTSKNVGFIDSNDSKEIEKLLSIYPELKDFSYNGKTLGFMEKSDIDEGWMDAFMDFSSTLPKAAEYFEMIDEFSSHLSDDGRYWGNIEDFATEYLHVDPDAIDRIKELNNALNEALGTKEDYSHKYADIGNALKEGSIDIQDAIREILQLEFPNNKIMETPDGVWVSPMKLDKTTKGFKELSNSAQDASSKALQFPSSKFNEGQDNIQEELKETQIEVEKTTSKYQGLLNAAQEKIKNDTSGYYSNDIGYEALTDFQWVESAKRANFVEPFEENYEKLSNSIDKIESDFRQSVISFDEAIDQLVEAYKKYDSATNTHVSDFDFLNNKQSNLNETILDTATALSEIEKYKKETAYINDILSNDVDEQRNNSIKQKYEELFDTVKNGSKSAQDAILDLSDHVNLCLGSTTELENILNRAGIKPNSIGGMSAGGISLETANFKIGENDYTLLQDYITGEFRLLDAQKQVIDSYKDYETVLHSFNNSVEELKQTQDQAEKTAQSVQDISKTQIKDVFQGEAEKSGMDAIASATEEAVQSKKDFATANEGVQSSIDGSKSPLQLEAELMDQIAKSARESANAKKEFVEANKQVKDSVADTNEEKKRENTEENANAWKELTYSIQRYSEVSKRISSGKALEGDIEEASRLENKISQLQKLDILSPTQIEKSEQMLTKLYDSLDDIEKKSKEATLESLNSSIDKYRNDYNSRSSKPVVNNQSDEYKKLLANYETSIKELEAYRDKISNNPLVSKEDLNQIDELKKKVKESAIAFNSLTASQKGSTPHSRGKAIEWANDLLEQNSKWSKKAKIEVQGWINKLATADPSNVEEIRNRILEIVRAEREAGNAGKTWLDIFSTKKLHNFLGQAASMFSFYDLVNVGREIVTNIKEVDTALTELRKVSDATEQRLTTNFKNSADTAKELGATISDVISATADWSRMGYNIDQAEELARVSTLYKNVGDGIDIETANNSLISTLQGFQLDTSEAESIIDKFNEVANNYAIDSAGIGEALQRSAASFNAANTDLSKSIALITATNEVVQDPDSVGTLWKTKFVFMYRNMHNRTYLIAGNA